MQCRYLRRFFICYSSGYSLSLCFFTFFWASVGGGVICSRRSQLQPGRQFADGWDGLRRWGRIPRRPVGKCTSIKRISGRLRSYARRDSCSKTSVDNLDTGTGWMMWWNTILHTTFCRRGPTKYTLRVHVLACGPRATYGLVSRIAADTRCTTTISIILKWFSLDSDGSRVVLDQNYTTWRELMKITQSSSITK